MASDVRNYRLQEVKEKWGIGITSQNQEAVAFADIIILCVKPQALGVVLEEIKNVIRDDQLIISIIAGITTRTIGQYIGRKNPVVRVMPNIPAVVDEAASAICLGEYAQDLHKEIANKIFSAVGEVEFAPEELMDVVTGLSGSGPAYIYMVIEALTDGGVLMGLPRNIATRLATQTVLGSAKLVRETNVHPAVLKDQVTTPGGTTILAIKELEESGLRPMLIRAVETATKRSRELSFLLETKNNPQKEPH
jgi:pyrroline-5-carboxylate reductase